VIPFHLTDEWNLISRTIMPLTYQPQLAPGIGEVFGLTDAARPQRRHLDARAEGRSIPRRIRDMSRLLTTSGDFSRAAHSGAVAVSDSKSAPQ
jgi:hypothetical protein